MAEKKKSFNMGHIAEYIFAIALGAGLYNTEKNPSVDKLKKKFDILLELFRGQINDKNIPNVLSVSPKDNNNLSIVLVVGKEKATVLGGESLRYFLKNQEDPKIKELVNTALKFVIIFRQQNESIWYLENPKIKIVSDGVIDQQTTKADVTLNINRKKYSFSVKTTSKKLHGTSLNAQSFAKVCSKLFGKNMFKTEDFLEFDFEEKSDLPKAFKIVIEKACNGNIVENKKDFILGLQVMAKLSNSGAAGNFQVVKLSETNFSQLIFSADYIKIASLFDYMLIIRGNTLYVDIAMNYNIPARFIGIRPQAKKLFIEAHTAINLLANRELKYFLKEIEMKKVKNDWVFTFAKELENKPRYKQVVSSFRTAKFFTTEENEKGVKFNKLTPEGEMFTITVKEAFYLAI